jgi:hypothetical protein
MLIKGCSQSLHPEDLIKAIRKQKLSQQELYDII